MRCKPEIHEWARESVSRVDEHNDARIDRAPLNLDMFAVLSQSMREKRLVKGIRDLML